MPLVIRAYQTYNDASSPSDWVATWDMGSYAWITEWKYMVRQLLPALPVLLDTYHHGQVIHGKALLQQILTELQDARSRVRESCRLLKGHQKVYDTWIDALQAVGDNGCIQLV